MCKNLERYVLPHAHIVIAVKYPVRGFKLAKAGDT